MRKHSGFKASWFIVICLFVFLLLAGCAETGDDDDDDNNTDDTACDSNADCPDDEVYCNGSEYCDRSQNKCAHRDEPCSDDGLWCNGEESCNEELQECRQEYTGDERCSDDGIFCNGQEFCDEVNDLCAHTGTPCPDDGNWCNGEDSCSEEGRECLHEYGIENPRCPNDGLFCNGEEYCDEDGDACLISGNPCHDDDIFCNGAEECDETNDQCISTGNPCPDDEIYCNGTESCNESINACDHSGDPCPDSLYCNGDDICLENMQACQHTGNPCPDDGFWCNGEELCDEEDDNCYHEMTSEDRCPDDGVFCNGAEMCDESIDECTHAGDPCLDDGLWCNGADWCNEVGDECDHEYGADNPRCPDDGLFCNGLSYCDDESDICLVGDEPCQDDEQWCNGEDWCNEDSDECDHEYTEANPRCPDDELFCNGLEFCNESIEECGHWSVPCADDGYWCNGLELCDEETEECSHQYSEETPRCPDDGFWCSGVESCDEDINQCVTTGDRCREDVTCHEDTQVCGEGEFRINTYTDHYQYASDVIIQSTGEFVTVWSSNGQDGDYLGVFRKHWDPDGNPLEGDVQVNTYTTSGQSGGRIGIDAEDNYAIVWTSLGQDGSDAGVFGQRFDALGNTVGDEFQVNTETDHNQRVPAISMDASGGFVVVWESQQQDDPYTSTEYGVYGQRYDSSGNPLDDEFLVNTWTDNDQDDPTIAMKSDGSFFVAWNSNKQVDLDDIFAQRYNTSGVPIGGEYQLNTHDVHWQRYPAMAMDGDGNFVVVWESYLDIYEYQYDIFARQFDSDGNPTGEEFQVNTTTIGSQSYADVAMNPNGDFVIVWTHDPEIHGHKEVFGRRYNSSGVALGDEFQINSYVYGSQQGPLVAMDDTGAFIVIWTSGFQDGSGHGAYGQRYDASGTPLPRP